VLNVTKQQVVLFCYVCQSRVQRKDWVNESHTKSVTLMTRYVWTSVATLLLRESTRFRD